MEPGILIRLPGTSSISKCQFEDSLQTAVRVSTRAILFLKERATCDLTIYIYIYLFIYFFLMDQEAEKWVYICLVHTLKSFTLQSELALEIFGILIQLIKATLISQSPSASYRIGVWSPLHALQFIRKKKESLWTKPHKQSLYCYYLINRTLCI